MGNGGGALWGIGGGSSTQDRQSQGGPRQPTEGQKEKPTNIINFVVVQEGWDFRVFPQNSVRLVSSRLS